MTIDDMIRIIIYTSVTRSLCFSLLNGKRCEALKQALHMVHLRVMMGPDGVKTIHLLSSHLPHEPFLRCSIDWRAFLTQPTHPCCFWRQLDILSSYQPPTHMAHMYARMCVNTHRDAHTHTHTHTHRERVKERE